MERQSSLSSKPVQKRFCEAQITEACRQRGGLLEEGRRATAKLCRDCAKRKRYDRSARWKSGFRKSSEPEKGWRAYRDKYSPYVDDKHRCECEREYRKERRARLRQQRAEANQALAV
jgi:hypothetical protein